MGHGYGNGWIPQGWPKCGLCRLYGGVQFIKRTVEASIKLHRYRYTHMEDSFRETYPQLPYIRQWMHELWESKHRGRKEDDDDPETEHGDEDSAADPDVADWTTYEDEGEWEARFRDDNPQDQGEGSSDEEVEWPLCDDIQVQ